MRIPPEVKPGAKRLRADSINAGVRALKELRRDAITKVPQLGGGRKRANADAVAEDDDRRTCSPAVAINLTGRDVEPGHVMPVETVATELDLTQLYPLAESASAVIKETQVIAQEQETLTLASPLGDDDLLIIFGSGSGSGFSPGLKSAWDSTIFDKWSLKNSYANVTDFAIEFNWGNAFPDRTVIDLAGDGSFTVAVPYARSIAIVLSGVERFSDDLDGTFIDPDDEYSLVVNGLQCYLYMLHDDEAADDTNLMALETNSTNAASNLVGLGGQSPSGWPLLSPTFEFPAGTQFLAFHHYAYENLFSTTVQRIGVTEGDLPAVNLIASDAAANNFGSARRESVYQVHMTTPLLSPGPPPVAAFQAVYEDWDGQGPNNQARDMMVIYALPPKEIEPPPFPTLPCDPLLCTEYLRAAPLTADTEAAKNAARELLDKSRYRDWVVAKDRIANGASGTVNRRGGYAVMWGNRRSLEHTHLGPPVETRERIAIYDAPLSGEVGKLGRFEKNATAAKAAKAANADEEIDDIDPRTACIAGLPFIGHSAMEGPFEVKQWGRDVPPAPAAITVTTTTTKTSQSGAVISGRWNNWTLSTGSDVDLAEPNNLWILNSTEGVFVAASSGTVTIDLTVDAATVAKPSYSFTGQRGTRQTAVSTDGLFDGVLLLNRWLLIRPRYAAWQGGTIAVDDPQTDTFVFTDDAIDPNIPDYAPYYYVNPETGEFGEVVESAPTGDQITYAAWPEAYPEPPSLVPTGTDIEDVAAGYDPVLGRVPGSVEGLEENDSRLGLQLCLVYITGWSSRNDVGCC